ncbi:MAG: MarR family winged helix-turn-helix transcriptional regulator [Myxococcota bacterium]
MDPLIDRIQTAFPRIWHRAHRQHAGRGTELSERDQRLLAHLSASATDTAGLAAHLGIAPSTLSEHLGALEARGLVERVRSADDGRRVDVALTEAGRAARRDSGPLDPGSLERALGRLADPEAVVAALEQLAEALR